MMCSLCWAWVLGLKGQGLNGVDTTLEFVNKLWGLGLEFRGLELEFWGLNSRVQGLGLEFWGLNSRVQGLQLEFRVGVLGFKLQSAGFTARV
jgi:hypothetical protein